MKKRHSWKRRVRRAAFQIPFANEHLMRDVGLEKGGRCIGDTVPDDVKKCERRIRHLRRNRKTTLMIKLMLSSRIPTIIYPLPIDSRLALVCRKLDKLTDFYV